MRGTLWLAVPLFLALVGKTWATEPSSLPLSEKLQFGDERPGDGPRDIGEIKVEGTIRVEEEAVRVRLGSRLGEVLDEAKVDKDVRAIYGMGFFSNVEAHLSQEQGQLVLTYRVQERSVIKTISFEGNKRIGKDDLEDALKVHPRTILNPVKIRRGIEEMKKKYEEKGYLDAQISYRAEETGHGEVALTFVIDEEDAVRIEDIAFEGNRAFADKKLRQVMSTGTRNWLSRILNTGVLNNEVLKTDIERLTAFYYDHGYINVRIDEPKVERRQDGFRITIRIDEGERFKVGEVDFGAEVPGDPEVSKKIVSLKHGKVFRASHLRDDVMKLTGYFSDLGYAFVNVEPETRLHPEEKTVDVTYQVSKGPEVFIDRVKITGNTKTRDKVIRREVQVAERGRFSATSLQRSHDMVQRLGLFQEVNVTTQRGSREDLLSVLVDVKEAQTGSFSIGAGFNSSTSIVGTAGVRENNFMGRGQQVFVSASIGTIYRNTQLSFTDPYFLDTYLTAGFDLFDWQFQFEDFDRSGTGGSVRFFYPLAALGIHSLWGFPTHDLRLGLMYEFERAEISDFDRFTPEAILSEIGKETSSTFTPMILRDTLNHAFDPTAGSLQQISLGYGGLGGTTDFIKLETEERWFFPVYRSPSWGTVTMMTGGFLGYGFGDKDFRPRFKDDLTGEEFFGRQVLEGDLPLFERYFPGGIDSVRGFGERTLGPREPVCANRETGSRISCAAPGAEIIDTDPIGGSVELILNNELIFPIVQPLGLKGLVFFDAGNAFTREQGIDVGDLRYSVGAGIRWKSPFGPIRIELGRALNAKSDERTSTVHFSFGGFGGVGSSGRSRRGVPF